MLTEAHLEHWQEEVVIIHHKNIKPASIIVPAEIIIMTLFNFDWVIWEVNVFIVFVQVNNYLRGRILSTYHAWDP